MSLFKEPLSELVWDIKYRYRKNKMREANVEETWLRVATAIAKAESSNPSFWQKEFYSILENFQFLPGGRILAGAGTKHAVTLFNCFVMPVSDSLKSIFHSLQEAALTLQEGGGVGYDFSSLRPAGFLIKKIGSAASGPVSFMRIWNAMCATMQSTGARRGAMMGILRCDHPDIERFIQAKRDPLELRHFNVSILVTDKFMQAVKENREWDLIFQKQCIKRVNARDLWQTIIKSAYDYAEPGVIFEDTINRLNTLWYKEKITATNPCGEIPLPPYGACNLGSINLTQFVTDPFTEKATLNWHKLEKVTALATRFLDNVIDVSRFPLKAQKLQALNTRRIGLGITGLADMFVMLNIRYGSAESIEFAAKLMKNIAEVTWFASIELAKERGSFPYFEKENYLNGEFVKELPFAIQNAIAKQGVRNSHHNTIAPAGTISLFANNISNGIEPIFSENYERTVRTIDGELKKFIVKNYALHCWQSENRKTSLPPAWIDAHALSPEKHLNMQAAMQTYIDNAISKTINIPENFPFDQLTEVYTKAFQMNLKGCTVFRPNAVTGSILNLVKEECDRCSPQNY